MNHDHHHHNTKKRLGIAIILNAVIFIVELVGGILTNSLALISDAMHNLSDFFGLMLSYIGANIVLWNSNHKKTFGYVRVEILIALTNAVTLIVVGFFIIYEAIKRIGHPEPIVGLWMLIIAVVGFLANAFSTVLLRKDSEHDLNVKSARLHLLTDAIQSLSVVIVGAAIYCWGWTFLDPLLSVAIGIFLIVSAWKIVLETVNILTEGTPAGIDVEAVAAAIRSFPGVENVHHIHIWSLSSQYRALSAHVVVRDALISDCIKLVHDIEMDLESKFHINHPTLKLETVVCCDEGIIVDLDHFPDRPDTISKI